MSDLINKFFSKAYFVLSIQTRAFFYNVINKLDASIRGINYGIGFKSYGKIYFYRYPNSKINIGKNCEFRSIYNSNLIGINRACIISTHSNKSKIIIGDDCGMSGVSIGSLDYIEIGNNVMVGANVIITDNDWHSLNPLNRRRGIPNSKPILISNNVFIGVNSIILKGTVIGENTVIGAGSVVSGVIPANVIAAGNPCKIIKYL